MISSHRINAIVRAAKSAISKTLLVDSVTRTTRDNIFTMGAYVSIPYCAAHYNVTLDCTPPTGSESSIGGVTPGNFAPDPDIAGIGVRFGLSPLRLPPELPK